MEKRKAEHIRAGRGAAGRRIDNYLAGMLRDIPRSRIYRMLRTGEVRVNGGRVRQDYRLQENDDVRVPPLFQGPPRVQAAPPASLLNRLRKAVLYEDERLLAINKPAGCAVHAGSGEQFGVIALMRALRPDCPDLELAHRLDKATSGCLLLAKDQLYLRELHELLRHNRIHKHYLALVYGKLRKKLEISLPLRKNELRSGERMVMVDATGKPATTVFHPVRILRDATLVQVQIVTGRTHQIRVHAASSGHPVAGDPKYGDRAFNRRLRQAGLRRMFLHAERLVWQPNATLPPLSLHAPLPDDLQHFLDHYGTTERD